MPKTPSIIDGPRLEVKKKVEYDIPCPKCGKEMRVTEVTEGAVIECNECSNVTWRMPYTSPWWAKTSHFILTIFFSMVFGIVVSFTGTWLYDKYSKSRDAQIELNAPSIKQKR